MASSRSSSRGPKYMRLVGHPLGHGLKIPRLLTPLGVLVADAGHGYHQLAQRESAAVLLVAQELGAPAVALVAADLAAPARYSRWRGGLSAQTAEFLLPHHGADRVVLDDGEGGKGGCPVDKISIALADDLLLALDGFLPARAEFLGLRPELQRPVFSYS